RASPCDRTGDARAAATSAFQHSPTPAAAALLARATHRRRRRKPCTPHHIRTGEAVPSPAVTHPAGTARRRPWPWPAPFTGSLSSRRLHSLTKTYMMTHGETEHTDVGTPCHITPNIQRTDNEADLDHSHRRCCRTGP